MPLTGGCLCGALRYRIGAEPLDAEYCHCRLCQRSTGAPVVAWVTVATDAFAWERGEPRTFRSSARAFRDFCGACGTQIVFRRPGAPASLDVTIASLDDPAAIPPRYHIWTRSRVGWLDLADALPRHEEAGPEST